MVKRLRNSIDNKPESNLLSEAQQEERQKIYLARLQDIATTCSNFKNAIKQFMKLERERAEKENWEQYLRCDSLPRPKVPAQIRTFLSKLRHFEDLEAINSVDWTLAVDERSVLTQNVFQKDLTRRVLENKTKNCPGPYFEVSIRNCLEVLRQVDVLMGNETEMEKLDAEKQVDIMNVYGDIQLEIESLFDRLTYRILAMQKAYMQSVDGKVANWSHSCEPWLMDLWGLLNVPIIFSQMEVPVMMADLPATGVHVQMPLSVLTDCLTLRCIHTSFDHSTEDAKSYENVGIDVDCIPNSGIIDMEKSVIGEWQMQQDIQTEVLMTMQRKREEYEDMMALIVERTDQAARVDKSAEKQVKIFIPKAPKEVPLVPPGMYPEVYDEFIAREAAQYKSFMENFYHPKHLNLSPYEVNLREHIMVGGIYSLMFVERTGQTQFQTFNIVLHHDKRVSHIIRDVVSKEEGPSDPSRVSRISEFTRATKLIEGKIKLGDNELPFFIVTIKLPPDLCKWGKPEVCHFLNEAQECPRKSISSIGRNFVDYGRMSSQSSLELGKTVSFLANQFAPTLKSVLRHSEMGLLDAKQVIDEDFSVDKVLDKLEIRNLETHCLPRTISSFKFPQEFNEEAHELSVSKAKPTRLVKRTDIAQVSAEALPSAAFDYRVQDHPERVFPHFPIVAPIQYRESFMFTDYTKTRSALGVVRTLEKIKQQYLDRPREFLLQIDPTPVKKEKKGERTENTDKLNFTKDSIAKEGKILEPGNRVSIAPREIRKSTTSVTSKRRVSRKLNKGLSAIRSKSYIHDSAFDTDSMETIMVNHWTTRYVFDASVDPVTNTLTFKTDRLGKFGLAFKRYEHFPFNDWSLQPNEDNPDEVILSVDTFHVRIFFYISSQGVRGYVTDLSKGYTANPVKYLEIKEPISDIRELRKTLVDKNINIFAENDASFYISNGYFSIKHVATEMHTYNTMALHCKSMKFHRSSWNRLALRRDLIMGMKDAKDTSDYTEVTVRITPEKTTFVKVSELCSDDVQVVKLSYEETWRNLNNYTDLNQAIHSMNPHAQEGYNKAAMLFINIQKILSEIRPLSYS